MALSTITKRGSATRAPKAGTASAMISRSCLLRRDGGVAGAWIMGANLIFHR